MVLKSLAIKPNAYKMHNQPTLTLNGSEIPKTQQRRTRHAGHCWRSRDELISNVLLWTPTYGCSKVGRPARTYIQQLREDTGCSPEDLLEAMNDTEKWRERVRNIRDSGTTWWYIYILMMMKYSKLLDISVWTIYGTLTGSATAGQ